MTHLPGDIDRNALMKQLKQGMTDSQKATSQIAFEVQIVKKILNAAGVTYMAALQKDAENTSATGEMSLDWFQGHFPRFPVRLFADKISGTHTVTIGWLFGRRAIQKSEWYKSYLEQTAGIDLRVERAALCFPLAYAAEASLMLLHNWPTQVHAFSEAECRTEDPYPRLTFAIGKDIGVLEPLAGFMQTIGTEWLE